MLQLCLLIRDKVFQNSDDANAARRRDQGGHHAQEASYGNPGLRNDMDGFDTASLHVLGRHHHLAPPPPPPPPPPLPPPPEPKALVVLQLCARATPTVSLYFCTSRSAFREHKAAGRP